MLIKYFRKLIKYVVYIGFIFNSFSSIAGSFEDFFTAIRNDEVKVISNLFERGFDPNTVNLQGEPAILNSLKLGSLKSFEFIAQHPKTNLNVRNSHGESALMLVCLKGELELAKMLIQRDADINHPGWTSLHYAATGGHTAIIQLLLDQSAYIDAESPNGTTPLMMAARYGNEKAVQLLITEGADWKLKNQLGLTALDFAVQGRRPEAIKLLQSLSSAADGANPKPQ
ncbi:MAG: ankyrin repeat domain-containing protein [Betaproteobacteria bacterium]